MSARDPAFRRCAYNRAGWRPILETPRVDDELDRLITSIEEKIDQGTQDGVFTERRSYPLSANAVETICAAIIVLKFLEHQGAAAQRLRNTIARIAHDHLDSIALAAGKEVTG